MYLLETIKIENKSLRHLKWHNDRLNAARQLLFGKVEKWDLQTLISLPPNLSDGVYKCRVTYGLTIQKIEFEPYVLQPIRSLKIVYAPAIDYGLKYADRSVLNALRAQRGDCDDVLIVKNGEVTDCSYCNIAFWDGQKWWTPNTPLLKGTHRARLLATGAIFEKRITEKMLPSFKKWKVFNAMSEEWS